MERDRYVVGNTVVVRAQLIECSASAAGGAEGHAASHAARRHPLRVALAADPSRKGMYSGQFTVTQEGECRLELLHPDAPDEPLTKRLQVFMPKLEQEHPERNDKLLKELADGTGGQFTSACRRRLAPKRKAAGRRNWSIKRRKRMFPGERSRVGRTLDARVVGDDCRLLVRGMAGSAIVRGRCQLSAAMVRNVMND